MQRQQRDVLIGALTTKKLKQIENNGYSLKWNLLSFWVDSRSVRSRTSGLITCIIRGQCTKNQENRFRHLKMWKSKHSGLVFWPTHPVNIDSPSAFWNCKRRWRHGTPYAVCGWSKCAHNKSKMANGRDLEKNRHISATVWPIDITFGMMKQTDLFILSAIFSTKWRVYDF